jgi:hypothetical protein
MITSHSEVTFEKSQTLSMKHALLGSLKELIFIHLMAFSVTQETVHKPICVMNVYPHFSSTHIDHPCGSPLSIALSFMTSHNPIFLSRIHLFPIFTFILPCK